MFRTFCIFYGEAACMFATVWEGPQSIAAYKSEYRLPHTVSLLCFVAVR